MSKEPKKKLFESKKNFNARKKADEKLKDYVAQDLQRVKPRRQVYQVTCGHCGGRRVMGNGKPCLNCGGSGKITRG